MLSAVQTERGYRFCSNARERAELERSSEVWIVRRDRRPICMVGLVRYNLMTAASYVWFKPLAEITRGDLRGMRRMAAFWFPQFGYISAHVRGRRNKRFAEFIGLREAPSFLGCNVYQWRAG